MNLRGVRESGTAFAIPTYGFIFGILGMVVIGIVRATFGSHMEAPRRGLSYPRRKKPSRRAGVLLPHPSRVFVGVGGADRGRGDQQRRAGVSQAEGEERREHSADDGPHRHRDVRRHRLRWPASPICEVAEPRARPDRRTRRTMCSRPRSRRSRTPCSAASPSVSLRGDRHGPDPRTRGEHRLQRLPRAGLDPRAEPLPAAPAAHSRRPAGLQQRHHHPGDDGRPADLRVQRRGLAPAQPLHHRRVRVVHGEPDGHDPALEPAAADGDGDEAAPPDERARVINAFGASVTGLVLVVVLSTSSCAGRGSCASRCRCCS